MTLRHSLLRGEDEGGGTLDLVFGSCRTRRCIPKIPPDSEVHKRHHLLRVARPAGYASRRDFFKAL
jgi:hypothetical protein